MTEIDKLRALVPHWIEHNTEHVTEFRIWVERTQALGQAHVAEHLAAAITKMEAVNHDLQDALDQLGGALDMPGHDHAHHDRIH